ncbi:MAG TPA: YicC family protein [Bdellovibrionales bacterium]|nr:YicC family protein [Bdellovibrionales bacterium]
MNSMTGYGSSRIQNRQLEIEIHVKSVNGRFLELRFHLPKEYAPFENDFRKAFSGWARGTVDVYMHRKLAAENRLQSVKVREANARYWAKTMTALAKDLGIKSDLTLRDVLQMPFVLEHQDRQNLAPGELRAVEKELKKSRERCEQVRWREGVMLKKELLLQLKNLEKLMDKMSGWRDEALKGAEQRLKTRLATLDGEPLDASRLALETALIIDKMDVHEEIVRLTEHLKACRALIAGGKEARGKKLDFYCQELLREVNTVGSKSQLASLTQVVVEAKSVIEKFREQVQNIE